MSVYVVSVWDAPKDWVQGETDSFCAPQSMDVGVFGAVSAPWLAPHFGCVCKQKEGGKSGCLGCYHFLHAVSA